VTSASDNTRESPPGVLPIGLLTGDRPCLVVGGGRIALRKAQNLVEAGAKVTVISPDASARIRTMADTGLIEYQPRPYEEGDAAGFFVVFAATDNHTVNGRVLEECREHGILCCAVDSHWSESAFMTPATLRTDDLLLSVSTAGRSCGQSRLVKDTLLRHVDNLQSADLLVLAAPRESLPDNFVAAEAARLLTQVWGLHEFMILDAGDRLELLGVAARNDNAIDLVHRILGIDRTSKELSCLKLGLAAFDDACDAYASDERVAMRIEQSLDQARNQGWGNLMLQAWVSAMQQVCNDQEGGECCRRNRYERIVRSFQGGHAR